MCLGQRAIIVHLMRLQDHVQTDKEKVHQAV